MTPTPVNGKRAGISTFTKFFPKNKKRISKVLTPVNWKKAGISTFTKFFPKKQEKNF
jgi:hypothetical protein